MSQTRHTPTASMPPIRKISSMFKAPMLPKARSKYSFVLLTLSLILISNLHRAKSSDEGGTATQRRDSNNSTAQAKKEHPEAPDVVIGMQDERGGKGA
jgi:hypothetical protein